MKKNVLKDILNVFDQEKAYSKKSAIKIDKFKDLKYSTEIIVKMMGRLLQGGIVTVDEHNYLYMSKEKWQKYCLNTGRKMIMVYAFSGLLTFLLFIIIQ